MLFFFLVSYFCLEFCCINSSLVNVIPLIKLFDDDDDDDNDDDDDYHRKRKQKVRRKNLGTK